jgi:hypothetical protein
VEFAKNHQECLEEKKLKREEVSQRSNQLHPVVPHNSNLRYNLLLILVFSLLPYIMAPKVSKIPTKGHHEVNVVGNRIQPVEPTSVQYMMDKRNETRLPPAHLPLWCVLEVLCIRVTVRIPSIKANAESRPKEQIENRRRTQ